MMHVLKSAQVLAVASTLSTTHDAGSMQVQPFGTLSISNDFISGSREWIARRRVAKREAILATQRLAQLDLIEVGGVITHRALCA